MLDISMTVLRCSRGLREREREWQELRGLDQKVAWCRNEEDPFKWQDEASNIGVQRTLRL